MQGKWLKQVVTGYFNYHAVPTNTRALAAFRDELTRSWQADFSAERSQRGPVNWEQMRSLANTWLPRPRHPSSLAHQRFAVTHPRWEPYAGKPHVRFCAGALSNERPYRDPERAIPPNKEPSAPIRKLEKRRRRVQRRP